MMTTDEKPTIAERYATASETSDMRMPLDRRCPADIIAAAAWSNEDGATLSRARNEFDKGKATIPPGIGSANRRMLILMRVPALTAAKEAVRRFALTRNERFGLRLDDEQIANLSWQALSVYLDPLCGHCGGRGFNSGYDGPNRQLTLRCSHCRETGKRRPFVGRSDGECNFIEAIIVRIEDAVCEFNSQTSQGMR